MLQKYITEEKCMKENRSTNKQPNKQQSGVLEVAELFFH